MTKKLIVLFALFALVAAIAGTVPATGPSYSVKLLRPSIVKGTELKEGDYRVNLGKDSVTIVSGKISVEVPAKIENAESKFTNTAVRYTEESGKSKIAEIRFGGTKTKVVIAE